MQHPTRREVVGRIVSDVVYGRPIDSGQLRDYTPEAIQGDVMRSYVRVRRPRTASPK